jgi:hypothetical protein
MTNLYELLRQILATYDDPITGLDPNNTEPGQLVRVSPEMADFIRNYLTGPEVLINFKARKVDTNAEGEPIFAQDYQIAGPPEEVFCLLTEAMIQNYQFATLIQGAASFYRDHIPTCAHCQKRHFGSAEPERNWIFDHPKPETDAKQ